jgi:hypothetical protein
MLKSPPILTALTPEEPMLLYITATTQVVSAALVVEREEPGRPLKVCWYLLSAIRILRIPQAHIICIPL